MLTNFDKLLDFDMDDDKQKEAVIKLLIDNNVMLKMILKRITKDDNPSDIISEYESEVAEMYVKLMKETAKK